METKSLHSTDANINAQLLFIALELPIAEQAYKTGNKEELTAAVIAITAAVENILRWEKVSPLTKEQEKDFNEYYQKFNTFNGLLILTGKRCNIRNEEKPKTKTKQAETPKEEKTIMSNHSGKLTKLAGYTAVIAVAGFAIYKAAEYFGYIGE